MKIEIDSNHTGFMIRSYDDSGIRVNNEVMTNSFIIAENCLIKDWSVANIKDLESSALDMVFTLSPDVLIIGSGKRQVFPDGGVLASIYAKKIGVEVMDTHSACRCYNILLSEGRNAAAALILD